MESWLLLPALGDVEKYGNTHVPSLRPACGRPQCGIWNDEVAALIAPPPHPSPTRGEGVLNTTFPQPLASTEFFPASGCWSLWSLMVWSASVR